MPTAKVRTKGRPLGIELKNAIANLEDNLKAGAPPLIIEDRAYLVLYKMARTLGYNLKKTPVFPIKKKSKSGYIEPDLEALKEFTGHKHSGKKLDYY
jgi:hypothetical protein